MLKKKKNIILILILLTLIIINNFAWYYLLKQEKEKLTHAIIPTLTNDYFLTQVALTKNMKNYQLELESNPNHEHYNYLMNVPIINQNPEFPNGCEAASAVMLLNYYGIEITLSDFIDKYLVQQKVYETEGKRFGPNPSIYYAGNPRNQKRGWGCFEPVIVNALQKAIADTQKTNIEVSIIRNDIKLPLTEYLLLEVPIMIWTTIDYGEVEEVYEWFSFDKKNTYTYPKNAHAIVITGKDDNYYYINDSLKNETNIPIQKEKLERSFDSMGRQLIALELINYGFEEK